MEAKLKKLHTSEVRELKEELALAQQGAATQHAQHAADLDALRAELAAHHAHREAELSRQLGCQAECIERLEAQAAAAEARQGELQVGGWRVWWAGWECWRRGRQSCRCI